MPELIVIGGGLAGSEAAWQAAQRGIDVTLYEMRPEKNTGAHLSGDLAELVCSNSLGSKLPGRASGLLKEELMLLNSLLLSCALETALPAGGALAVDRSEFARTATSKIKLHPQIRVIREEAKHIPSGAAIIASGPLTSEALASEIQSLTGRDHMYFYDAIAPVIYYESIDFEHAFRSSRYNRGELEGGDYINCPMSQDEYHTFVSELVTGERIELQSFEADLESGVLAGSKHFFEGCLPVEVLARRGSQSLAFGPLRPVGLKDPKTGCRPYAVLQLRQDNLAGTLYNMVGFQTNLKFPEQRRIFRMIPGLKNAEFARYGQMHRNTYIFSPKYLQPTMQYFDKSVGSSRESLFFAGQITGVEGYAGNIATGLLAGWNAARMLEGRKPIVLPRTTMIGSLCHYVTNAHESDFQPMKANFGILPSLENPPKSKRERGERYSQRALEDLAGFLNDLDQ